MNFKPLASSSSGNAYLVEAGDNLPLLLECGISIKQLREKTGFSLAFLAGCLVSHAHGDHSKALRDLLKNGVDVWTSQETAQALGVADHHRMNVVTAGEASTIDGWTILPFDLHHDVSTHGFLIAAPDGEKLLFIPDTSYIRNRFERVHVIAIECNYVADVLSKNILSGSLPAAVGHRTRRNHMSLDTVISMLKANDLSVCREVWLLHLSDANSNEREMVRKVQEATGIPTFACGE